MREICCFTGHRELPTGWDSLYCQQQQRYSCQKEEEMKKVIFLQTFCEVSPPAPQAMLNEADELARNIPATDKAMTPSFEEMMRRFQNAINPAGPAGWSSGKKIHFTQK